ncbi:uncharacterized protein LOC121002639 [Bufo bufo]|uniref:uncharacterized protein LOC121002639 n=1 Tax=Bufo bufo TaxID=8384 RepID=UPI001ABE19E1|nr:uncharacterized protein LOC121002639 [Bufo bufo]
MFDPESLHHPRSAEWLPSPHVGAYLEHWVRHSLSRESRNKLRAECPRPLVPNKVCETPIVDPKMAQFLTKTGWNSKKGLDSALRSCQDKILDVLGPLTKILEMAESARSEGSPIDHEELRGWAQRAICLTGNANTSVAIERRKSILFKIDPKLANLALTEAGKEAQGLLFGESFIKDMGRFVGTFTALDKAQSSMRRVFHGRVSHRAGSGRGRLSGRASFQARGANRGAGGQRPPFQDQRNPSPFFASRGHQWRSRSFRGNPSHRRPLGKSPSHRGFYGTLCRGPTPALFSCLGPHHLRSVGADHGQGISHRTHGVSLPCSLPPANPPVAHGLRPGGRGATLPQTKAGYRASVPGAGGCDQQYIPRSKERRADEASHQSSRTECGGSLPSFQDGGDPSPTGLTSAGGLDGKARPEGCLPDGPSGQLFQGLAPVQVEWRGLEVHLSAIRTVVSSLVLHQVAASGRVMVEDSGRPPNYLPGRHPSDARIQDLGFLLNIEKSCLIPARRMEFLGFTVDSLSESLSLPTAKLRAIRKELRHALLIPHLSLRHLARIIGLLASSIQAVFPAPLHYRALHRLKIAHLRTGASFADAVVLDSEAREELSWWIANLEAWNGRAIFGSLPELTIESDASLQGWGAHCNGVSTGGPWSAEESLLHINALELLAGSFAVRSFSNGIANACIKLRMDNISAVQYVNRLGGTRSATLARLAKDFWTFCLSKDIMVQAEYLPGLNNVQADWNSRYLSDGSDWQLDPRVFSAISELWGPVSIDLFASRLNRQLTRFYSWRPDPEALAVDAFLQDWSVSHLYAFPPFSMIPRTLLQVIRQQADLVLVVPFWGSQVWFPSLLRILVEIPVLLPTRSDLLHNPLGLQHPLLLDGSLRLLACRISGHLDRSREFRQQLDSYWTVHGLPALGSRTGQPGELGLTGAWNGTWIPFRHL